MQGCLFFNITSDWERQQGKEKISKRPKELERATVQVMTRMGQQKRKDDYDWRNVVPRSHV